MADPQIYKGACHCGAVKFEVTLSNGFKTIRRCTCSYCRMRGGTPVSAELSGLRILEGADKLSMYQFNTRQAKHYFCSVCGIYTHHQRRSNLNHYGISVACLEGISPYDFEEVPVVDGINHPNDNNGKMSKVGVMKFVKA